MRQINELDPSEAAAAGARYDAGAPALEGGNGVGEEWGDSFVPSIDRELEAAFEYKLSMGGREAVGEILDIFAAVLRRRVRSY